MLRKLLGAGAVLAVVLAGCRGPKGACDTNEDCGEGRTCDATVNLCFVTVTPDGAACTTACSEFQACKDGSCTARFSGYTFVMPRADGAVKSGTVQLKVQLVPRADIQASPNYPASIGFIVKPKSGGPATSGTLTRDAEGFYVGTWDAPQGTSGDQFDLEVRSDALADAGKTSFRLDNDAPVFTVSVITPLPGPNTAETIYLDPGLPNAWRRDQVVTVAVSANEAVDASSVRLSVTGIGEGTQMAPLEVEDTGTGCGQSFCGQVQVDLSKPPMQAFRGTFSLDAAGNDVAGNSGAGTKSINVTRWKWSHDAKAGPIQSSPAIGEAGTIYVGTKAGSSSGSVIAINPNGRAKWSNTTLGAIVSSPGVGSSSAGGRIYVAATSATNGTLYALSPTTGIPNDEFCSTPSARVEGSLALLATEAGAQSLETAVAVANAAGGGSGVLTSLRVGGGTNRCSSRSSAQNVLFPGGVVSEGSSVYYSDSTGSVRGYSFRDENWEVKQGWPVSTGFSTHALAIANSRIVAGGVGGPGEGSVLTLPLSGVTSDSFALSVEAWNPSIGPGGNALVGLADGSLLKMPVDQVSSATPMGGTGISKGAPLFGAGGLVYRATDTGALEVLTMAFGRAWSEDAFGSAAVPASLEDVQGSLAIDCARPDAGGGALPGRPGVLYVPSTNGKLYAFVVDSRGLDTNAPWPKYQRDPRNSGNADGNLSEYACP